MAYRILFISGGTGGHAYPVFSIASSVRERAKQLGKEIEVEILGDGPFLAAVAEELGYPFRPVATAKLRTYFSLQNFTDFFKLPAVFFQALYQVWHFMPDIVFAKGGYSSLIPCLVAKLLFIPIYIHESDAVPGRANRILAGLSRKIFISFEKSAVFFNPAKIQLVGHPIRKELLGGDRARGLELFKLDSSKPVILVTGGSQGAEKINNIVVNSLVELTPKFQIIHQAGEKNYPTVKAATDQIQKEGGGSYGKIVLENYHLVPFFSVNDLAQAYAVANIIVSRAGAGSLFEIAAIGKPAIIIPITDSASDHQMVNAAEFAKFGAIVIREENLTTHLFINQLGEAYEKRVELSQKIAGFARLNAADEIAKVILS